MVEEPSTCKYNLIYNVNACIEKALQSPPAMLWPTVTAQERACEIGPQRHRLVLDGTAVAWR